MKKIIIITIVIIAFVAVFMYFRKKKTALSNVSFEVKNIKIALPLKSLSDVIDIVSNLAGFSFPLKFDLNVKNPSDTEITATDVYINCFADENSQKQVAESTGLIPELKIKGKSFENLTPFVYNLNMRTLIDIYKSKKGDNTNFATLYAITQNWISTGKIGIDLYLIGFAKIAGIEIPINQKISI